MSEVSAWCRSLPCPGVSRRTNSELRGETSLSKSDESLVLEGRRQVAVCGSWLVWVVERVPLVNCRSRESVNVRVGDG